MSGVIVSEVVMFYDVLKVFIFGSVDDVDVVFVEEDVNVELVVGIDFVIFVDVEFDEMLYWFDVGFFEVFVCWLIGFVGLVVD